MALKEATRLCHESGRKIWFDIREELHDAKKTFRKWSGSIAERMQWVASVGN